MNNLHDTKRECNCDSSHEGEAPAHIRGINCEVKGCTYNECEKYCTAEKINIGPQCATCTPETICATFRPKQG